MATIVNNPADRTERVVESSDNGGWAVAVIVLLAVVLIGAFVWMRYYQVPAASQSQTPGSANVNVTLPANTGTDNTGGTNNSSGGTGATNPSTY
jgi:hypothetical protein